MTGNNNTYTLSWRTLVRRLQMVPKIPPMALNTARTLVQFTGLSTGHHKVFAIGYNKTATTSIHTVFQELGMQSLHKISWRDTNRIGIFLPYQCFSDGPPENFETLDRRFKRSKFILNIRDLDEWIDSRLEHIRLSIDRGVTMNNKYWDRTDFAVKDWVLTRNSYHLQVLDYFRERPSDLLVLNYIRDPKGGQKISGFLAANQVAEKKYVRSTEITRKQGVLRNETQIHRCLNELGVPESAWKTDIHCPITSDNNTPTDWPFDSKYLEYPKVLDES